MPALTPPPAHPPAGLHVGKVDCPRCGCRYLNPETLICLCSAEFTPAGLEHIRSLPLALQRRS